MWSQSVCYWLLLTWLSCSRSTWSWKHQVWYWSVISVTCFAKAVDNLGNLFGWNINKHCFTETYGIIVLYHYAVERALGVLSILRRCHSSCKLQLSSLGSLSNDDDKALKKNAFILTSEIRSCLVLFGTPVTLKTYLRWMETVFSTFQDLEFDGSL